MLHLLQAAASPAAVPISGPLLVSYVLLDIFLILVLARILGTGMQKLGQPRVVGEILAGILLGPTLLGSRLSQTLAPLEARPVLNGIATLALLLFMFLAGVEFDTSRIAGRGRQAFVLAALSVAVPALLAFPLAGLMHTSVYAGPHGEALVPFAMFLGAALAVTAFPVMAHILMERGELNSPIGGLSVATAGIMSIMMFLYLGLAGSIASSQGLGKFILNIGYVILFLVAAWFLVRPLLARWLRDDPAGPPVTPNGMGLVFAGMILFGLVAHVLKVNALVGGFLWGLILPESRRLRDTLAGKVRDVAMVFLLPVFFSIAGFSTDLKLLSVETIPIVLLVLLAAIGGKFLAALPARAFGLTWRDAGFIGALMNTRGLLVLVAGLIGLQLGIITQLSFTILVVVALVTNLMTLPLLRIFTPAKMPQAAAPLEPPVFSR